ncbi:MAG TPA: DUF502 domain-containing protein [Bacteroidales bacterium]|nr:DUF502 domain-containing protein [Bacteroidales bacterium]
MRKKLIGYFLQGLFYIAPLGVTAFIIYKIILFFDSLFLDVTHFYFPGIGLIIIIVAITLLGFLANTFFAKPAIQFFNAIILHMPVIRDLYLPLKDFFAAIVGKDRKFNKPVLVKLNHHSDIQKVGFITQEDLSELGIKKGYISVYFPHSYAFSGELFVVPIENVVPLNIPPSVAMKFIISGGAIKNFNEND